MTFLLLVIILVEFLYFYNKIETLREDIRSGKIGDIKTPTPGHTQLLSTKIPTPPISIVPKPPLTPQPIKPAAPHKNESFSHDFEFKLGSKIFTGIGAVAIIFGVSFFIRYAFENNLVTETMRVILGLLAGIILITIGGLTWRRFSVYGQIVMGGGVGVLYLSAHASYNFYHLVPQPIAFAAMVVITLLGIALAIRFDSISLAGFSQLGGFLTPFLLSTGKNDPHGLFLYITLLDLAIVILAFWKLWRPIVFGGFAGTIIVYLAWFFNFFTQSQLLIAESYLTLFFLLFLGITLIYYFTKKSPQDELDLILLTLNPALYFILSYNILNPVYSQWTGTFTTILAVLYIVTSIGIQKTDEASNRLKQFFLGIGFVFLVIAVPIQFNTFWITIAWAAEAFVLTLLGFQLRSKNIIILSLGVFTLTVIRLFFFDSVLSSQSMPWINIRVLTSLFCIISLALAALIYKTEEENPENQKISPAHELKKIFSVLVISTYILILWTLSAEIIGFNYPKFWLPIIWSLGALGGGYASLVLREKSLRVTIYITFIIAILNLLVEVSAVNLGTYIPVFNTRVLSFAIVACALAIFGILLRQRDQEGLIEGEKKFVSNSIFLAVNLLLFWVFNLEIADYFNRKTNLLTQKAKSVQRIQLENLKNVSLSMGWILYGIILLILGITKKSAIARILAIVIFGLAVFKVFLFDTIYLNNLYRFVSFITLGLILLLAGYLYHRYRDRITRFIQI